MHETSLRNYGLARIADVRIEGNNFRIDVTDASAFELEGCLYAFVVNGEIVRIGSSTKPLKARLAAWRRDVSTALSGAKSATRTDEAERPDLDSSTDVPTIFSPMTRRDARIMTCRATTP